VAKPTRSRAPAAGTRASVTAVLFLRGGGVLATGGTGDACVKLWDARNLAEPMVRAQPCGVWMGTPMAHASCVLTRRVRVATTVSPSPAQLLVGAERTEQRNAGRRRGVTALAADADGGRLLAAYSDSTVRPPRTHAQNREAF
jgi:hypothetical protein